MQNKAFMARIFFKVDFYKTPKKSEKINNVKRIQIRSYFDKNLPHKMFVFLVEFSQKALSYQRISGKNKACWTRSILKCVG